jgi:hypothetical protein
VMDRQSEECFQSSENTLHGIIMVETFHYPFDHSMYNTKS